MVSKVKRRAFKANRGAQRVCAYCGRKLSCRTATIDHVLPLSRGGIYKDSANVVLSCSPCNHSKGALTADEFRSVICALAL